MRIAYGQAFCTIKLLYLKDASEIALYVHGVICGSFLAFAKCSSFYQPQGFTEYHLKTCRIPQPQGDG